MRHFQNKEKIVGRVSYMQINSITKVSHKNKKEKPSVVVARIPLGQGPVQRCT